VIFCQWKRDFQLQIKCNSKRSVEGEGSTGLSKGNPGDAKCVKEILGEKNKEVMGDKIYFFVSRDNKRIKIQNFPGDDSHGSPFKRAREQKWKDARAKKRGRLRHGCWDGRPWEGKRIVQFLKN